MTPVARRGAHCSRTGNDVPYGCHVWIGRGLRETAAPPFSKDLARGVGMEDMLRALAIPLLGLAVPLLVWLAVVKPF